MSNALLAVLVDVALVAESPRIVQMLIICTILLFLAFERVEAVLRFGAYSTAEWSGSAVPELCDCAAPPNSPFVHSALYFFFTVRVLSLSASLPWTVSPRAWCTITMGPNLACGSNNYF